MKFPHVFKSQLGKLNSELGVGDSARTTTEQRMCLLSATLRSKPSWWIKYKDPEVRSKWRIEALDQVILGAKLKEVEVDYVLDELAGYDLLREHNTGAEVSCFGRIWQSDTLISTDLRELLVSEIKKLEDVPEEKKYWRPGSNNMVLDLVHPSPYCIVYRRTRGYPQDSDPTTRTSSDLRVIRATPMRRYGPQEYRRSGYTWIPTDFNISKSGNSAKAKAYINNLYPSHVRLYEGLEMLVARFSHLFDRVLTDLHPSNRLPCRTVGGYFYDDKGRPEMEEGEDTDAYNVRLDAWQKNRPLILPTVSEQGYSGDLHNRSSRYSIQGGDVQIIVKLANIHLTPEKPEYTGGSWRVEGMANERIIASGIYYYSSDNITSNHLAFRESVAFKEYYEQNDDYGLKQTWGFERDKPCCQDLGAVETTEGRCIAFPNIYQHKVSSFKLVDATKPGHRKIVALFLVDPSRSPILSTSSIPPQQASWVREAFNEVSTDSPLHKLPAELLDMISQNVSTTMTEEVAKLFHEASMKERTQFVELSNERFFQVGFHM